MTPKWLYWPAAAGGTPWTPTEMTTDTLRLWVKADAGVFDATSGGNLITNDNTIARRWEDQSGVGLHSTNGGGDGAPRYRTNALNGLPVMRFRQEGSTFRGFQRAAASIWANDTGSVSIFIVAQTSLTAGGDTAIFSVGGYQPNPRWNGSTNWRTWFQMNSWNGVTKQVGAYNNATNSAANTWHVMLFRTDFGSASNNLLVRRDGGVVNHTESATFTNATIGASTATLVIAGRGSETLEVFAGDIAELLVVTNDLTNDTRDRVEGYLAHKWGLEGNLPSGHPYKNAAPSA